MKPSSSASKANLPPPPSPPPPTPSSSSSSTTTTAIDPYPVFAFVASMLLYKNTLKGAFVWDDRAAIVSIFHTNIYLPNILCVGF